MMVQGEISIVPIANGGDSIMSIGLAATFDAIRKTSDIRATFWRLEQIKGDDVNVSLEAVKAGHWLEEQVAAPKEEYMKKLHEHYD